MAAKPKSYPAYKDSGVPWLGEVPSHWSLLPNRAMLCRRKILVGKRHTDYELLSLTKMGVIVRDVSTGRGKFSADMGTSQEVRCGDLIFCLFDVPETPRTVGLSQHKGMITGAYSVFECNDHVLTRYLEAFYIAMDDRKLLSPLYSGLRNTIPTSRFLGVKTPVPPLPEQTAIVRFLDHADRRIRRYIRAKQKLIALLEEQKQAIIDQAVTGQVDVRTGQPYPAYKPSGVEWLGEVPTHWEVVQLRRVALDRCDGPFGSGLKSSHYTEDGIRVVRLQNIGHGEFRNSDAAFISPEYYSSLGDHSVVPGDILIAGLGDNNHPAGRACVAPENIIPAMVKADCFRFRLDQDRVQPRFAALQLTATATVTSALLSTGATRQRINLQSTSARAISIPAFPEQVLIVDYIATRTSGISAAQDAARREINLLHEYRTRLIADVVTGKLDVREAAARLPDGEAEPKQSDKAQDLIDAAYAER